MMKKRFFIAAVLIVVTALLWIGGVSFFKTSELDTKSDEPLQTPKKLSVWAAYWDLDNVKDEVRELQTQIDNVCYFAAYFDHKDQLMIPKETTQLFQEMNQSFGQNTWEDYLTFVNDKILADGSSSLKDTKLLYILFSSEDSMDSHIDEILQMALAGGYEGIEIDYEAIRKDMDLWKLYEEFCRKLYQKASDKGLKMRVLLEPNSPLEKLSLPEGPEYIMMCYNLYGSNTEPGPKANKEFIAGLIGKMAGVPGKKSFALATGGFDWSQTGKAKSVCEVQAETLIEQYGVTPVRDQESQCLKFNYEDTDGVKHEVWYADAVTLQSWMDAISESGEYGISIWRLGGNKF